MEIRPKLRSHLRRVRRSGEARYLYLEDQLSLSPGHERLDAEESSWLDFFTGEHTLREISSRIMSREGGRGPSTKRLADLIARLDSNRMLDTLRFRNVVHAPVRAPRHIGCYQGEPTALRQQIHDIFNHPRGPGLPRAQSSGTSLHAALVPHMDYHRGGIGYAWGFKEIFENTDASLFVIIGTSHYSSHRFTITRKDFETPLGVIPTDQNYIDRLVAEYGEGLFDDEWLAHFPEHSIELEVVFLHYLYEKKRPIRIVPMVVGSFDDWVGIGESPMRDSEIRRMVAALRSTELQTEEPICYIISGDLAHIGPKFNPDETLTEDFLKRSQAQDQAILVELANANPARYLSILAEEANRRNVCGLSPTMTVLEAIRPQRGKVLSYERYLHPQGYESVSFASAAFYR